MTNASLPVPNKDALLVAHVAATLASAHREVVREAGTQLVQFAVGLGRFQEFKAEKRRKVKRRHGALLARL